MMRDPAGDRLSARRSVGLNTVPDRTRPAIGTVCLYGRFAYQGLVPVRLAGRIF